MIVKPSKTRRVNGSPAFTYSNDVAITDTSKWIISFDDTYKEFDWLPFDFIRIINHSSYDLIFYKNHKQKHIIKAGSPYTIKREDIDGGYFLARNSGETIVIGDVDVLLQKLPIDADELVREREAKGFFGVF